MYQKWHDYFKINQKTKVGKIDFLFVYNQHIKFPYSKQKFQIVISKYYQSKSFLIDCKISKIFQSYKQQQEEKENHPHFREIWYYINKNENRNPCKRAKKYIFIPINSQID